MVALFGALAAEVAEGAAVYSIGNGEKFLLSQRVLAGASHPAPSDLRLHGLPLSPSHRARAAALSPT